MTPEERNAISREIDRHVVPCTRREALAFRAELDKTRSDRYKAELKLVGCGPAAAGIEEGDTLKVNYQLNIDYMGQVERTLDAFATIISDPDVVVALTVDELEHGRSVIFDLVQQVVRVQDIIKKRQFDAGLAEKTVAEVAKATAPGFWARLRAWWSR